MEIAMLQGMRLCIALLVAAAACGPAVEEDGLAVLSEDVTAGTLQATNGTLELTMESAGVMTTADGHHTYTFAGRSSHELEGLSPWVPDDAFGHAELTSPRTFSLTFDDHEMNSLFAGLRLRVRLYVKGWKKQVNAGIVFAPRLDVGTGTREVQVVPSVRPIFYGGALAYRAAVKATSASLFVTPTPSRIDHAQFDFTYDALAAAQEIRIEATTTAGVKKVRTTRVIPSVIELALTTADPERHWPMPTCAAKTQACLDKLPHDGLDASSCGSFAEVRVCEVKTLLPDMQAQVVPTAIAALEKAANAALKDGQHVVITAARFDWAAMGDASLDQVLRGVSRADAMEGAVIHGAATREQLDSELKRFHLEGLPAAIAAEVFFDALDAGRISYSTEAAAGARDAHDAYVLSVPGTGVLYVAELIENER